MNECPICLEILENQNEIIKTNCNHQFCSNCLIEWVRRDPQHHTCPICRSNLNNCVISINDPSSTNIQINILDIPITTQIIDTFTNKFISILIIAIFFFLIVLLFYIGR